MSDEPNPDLPLWNALEDLPPGMSPDDVLWGICCQSRVRSIELENGDQIEVFVLFDDRHLDPNQMRFALDGVLDGEHVVKLAHGVEPCFEAYKEVMGYFRSRQPRKERVPCSE
jgi:hypothetical protein